MKKILILVLFAALAAFLYMQWQEQPTSVLSSKPRPGIPAAPSVTPAPPRYPIPTAPPVEIAPLAEPQQQAAEDPLASASMPEVAALPQLNASNAEMTELFSAMFGSDVVRELFNLDEIIRRFVVTIDNLPNKKLPRQHLLVKRVAGPFQVLSDADSLIIAPENAVRYAPFLRVATQVDARRLVTVYVRHYALFQEAYAELGVPGAYFNDRLVDVIEHLLNAPVVDEPVKLVQPKVFYAYADPDLESRSAGQKILMRMGNVGAEQIKNKLREIRRLLKEPALLQNDSEPSAVPETTSTQQEE